MSNFTRTAFRIAAISIAVVGSLCLAYGYFIEPHRLVVSRAEISVDGWQPEFDGLRIVLVSDIHGGSNGVSEMRLREVVSVVNAQKADIVVLLGDYVSYNARDGSIAMPVETIAENLKGMSAKYGVFAVLGNHDGWYGDAQVSEKLSQAGYRVLVNEVEVMEVNGRKLRLFGSEDALKLTNWKQLYDRSRSILGDDANAGDVILLQHNPDMMAMAVNDPASMAGLKLILAGHTHGGQVWLPVLGSPIVPSTYGQKYARGHIYEKGIHMFVTTGIGTSILPFRFLMPPEIVVLTVRGERH